LIESLSTVKVVRQSRWSGRESVVIRDRLALRRQSFWRNRRESGRDRNHGIGGVTEFHPAVKTPG
jgi:hypothetical protein